MSFVVCFKENRIFHFNNCIDSFHHWDAMWPVQHQCFTLRPSGHLSVWGRHVKLFTCLLLFHRASQCSKSCGSGRRRRALQCVDQNRQEVNEMYCVNLIRPPDQESCNTQGCELIWITGEWTEVRGQTARVSLLFASRTKLFSGNRNIFGWVDLSTVFIPQLLCWLVRLCWNTRLQYLAVCDVTEGTDLDTSIFSNRLEGPTKPQL